MKYKALVSAITVGVSVFVPTVNAASVDATDTLPDAKPGQCYAKVMIPAKYESKKEIVLVGEASEEIEPIPAVYQEMEEQVLVEKADTKLIPIPAEFETITDRIELSPRRTVWVDNLDKKGIPVSPILLNAAETGGVELDKAIPGMCFREYYTDPQFQAVEKEIMVNGESESISIVPAKYEWIEEKVQVKESAKKIVEVPAVYETITENVLVEPAKTVWKKGSGLIERIDNTTGEIMCLVEIPAQYKTFKKRVIKSPATIRVEEIPAVYKTVKVRNLVSPAKEERTIVPAEFTTVSTQVKIADASFLWHAKQVTEKPLGKRTGNQICLKEIPAQYKEYEKRVLKMAATIKTEEIPAVYSTVKVEKLVSNAQEKRTTIPAEYKTVTTQTKVADERLEWRQVLCETNMTKDVVTQVQTALNKAGYDVGSIDGVIGGATLRAVDSFQRDRELPRGGLTIDMLGTLGVSL